MYITGVKTMTPVLGEYRELITEFESLNSTSSVKTPLSPKLEDGRNVCVSVWEQNIWLCDGYQAACAECKCVMQCS
jgi:hypothetical protein